MSRTPVPTSCARARRQKEECDSQSRKGSWYSHALGSRHCPHAGWSHMPVTAARLKANFSAEMFRPSIPSSGRNRPMLCVSVQCPMVIAADAVTHLVRPNASRCCPSLTGTRRTRQTEFGSFPVAKPLKA
jgi:hypothetical protein